MYNKSVRRYNPAHFYCAAKIAIMAMRVYGSDGMSGGNVPN